MSNVTAPPADAIEARMRRIALIWIPATLGAFGLCVVGSYRVGGIDPALARAGGLAGLFLRAVVAAALGILVGVLLDELVGRVAHVAGAVARRLQPDATSPAAATVGTTRFGVTMATLALAGSWIAFRWLVIPLEIPGRGLIRVPLIAASAGTLLSPLSIGLGLEAVLALVRLMGFESRRWWVARGLLRLAWVGFLVVVITGANLLAGDPLEWAERLGAAHPTAGWLESAPRAMAPAWPLAQVALAGALVGQILGLVREAPMVWRRTRPR